MSASSVCVTWGMLTQEACSRGPEIFLMRESGAVSVGMLMVTARDGALEAHNVPVPHFGLVLPVEDFQRLAGRLRAAGTTFVIEPYVRFAGEVGEQHTMFFYDPAGNPLEFKAFADLSQLFAH